jgi:hypothetical protein
MLRKRMNPACIHTVCLHGFLSRGEARNNRDLTARNAQKLCEIFDKGIIRRTLDGRRRQSNLESGSINAGDFVARGPRLDPDFESDA